MTTEHNTTVQWAVRWQWWLVECQVDDRRWRGHRSRFLLDAGNTGEPWVESAAEDSAADFPVDEREWTVDIHALQHSYRFGSTLRAQQERPAVLATGRGELLSVRPSRHVRRMLPLVTKIVNHDSNAGDEKRFFILPVLERDIEPVLERGERADVREHLLAGNEGED